MLIAEDVLEQALAQVFDGKSAGGCMSLSDIAEAWNKVGLRKSDLRDAIREMVEAHCLTTQSHLGNLEFTLTERGASRFDVCRHHPLSPQDGLQERGEIQSDSATWSAVGESWNRHALQH